VDIVDIVDNGKTTPYGGRECTKYTGNKCNILVIKLVLLGTQPWFSHVKVASESALYKKYNVCTALHFGNCTA